MLKEIVISIRPKQWMKNLIVFAALIFSRNLFNLEPLFKTSIVFFDFCLLSSGLYIINDLLDRDKDRFHPLKSSRPIARGTLPIFPALMSAVLMIAVGLIVAAAVNVRYMGTVLFFLAINIAYSLFLKNIVILDVFTIAIGFILRAVAGADAISVTISGWLFVCTLLLALFLGFGKRFGELNRYGQNSKNSRKVLEHYSLDLLEQIISVIAAATIAAYAVYTMSEETVNKFHSQNLKYTLLFVIYGVLRYIYIIKKEGAGEVPEDSLILDRGIILNILFYVVAVICIIGRG